MPGYGANESRCRYFAERHRASDQIQGKRYMHMTATGHRVTLDLLVAHSSGSRTAASTLLPLNVQNDASQWVSTVKNKDAIAAGTPTKAHIPDMPASQRKSADNGLYVARVVTFQQKTMARATPTGPQRIAHPASSGRRHAGQGGTAGRQILPFRTMADMTKEVLALGVDEVQYDYIRSHLDLQFKRNW